MATGTTNAEGLPGPGPYNDGIFVWTARSLKGPWKLADTTKFRPGADKGKVWSPEFASENTDKKTYVAPWQEWWEDDGEFGKRGNVWAPEIHYHQGVWYIMACMGDHSAKVGSFLLISEGGVEGPYRVAKGNLEKPFGDLAPGPDWVEKDRYHFIDGSMYYEGKDACWCCTATSTPSSPTTWKTSSRRRICPSSRRSRTARSPTSRRFRAQVREEVLPPARGLEPDHPRRRRQPPLLPRTPRRPQAVPVRHDRRGGRQVRGPYSERYTAGVGIGHNNFFVDHTGKLWGTFFLNPASGYYSNPTRVDEAAVAGVVELEWTGPKGNRIQVKRPS